MSSVTDMRQQVESLNMEVGSLHERSLGLRKELHMIEISLSAIQKVGGTGNETLDEMIKKGQEMLMIYMRLHMLMWALSEAEAGVFGPIGWLYAGANAVGFGMALTTLGQ
jgi:hypothetical protein